MGLRVNRDEGASTALGRLRQNSAAQARLFNKLSTGLRINSAADDPSGLVISNLMRSQLAGLQQASENTSRASNLVSTADAALGQQSEMLINLRRDVLAAQNSGALDPGAQRALQASVDHTLQALNRVSNTTRFGDINLLNGQSAFETANADPELTQIRIDSANLSAGTPRTVTVDVTANATQANTAATPFAAQAAASTVQIQGNLGTATLNFAAGATQPDVATAINQISGQTGVTADAVTGVMTSQGYGSDQFVRVTQVSGTFTGFVGTVSGTDAVATVDGQVTSAQGNVLNVSSPTLTASVRIDPTAAAGTYTFDITGGGRMFQLNDSGAGQASLGLQGTGVSFLGNPEVGFLSSIGSGGTNDLMSNATQAMRIVDEAISQVSSQRASLGSFESQVLRPNINALEVHIENLAASESEIRDLDYAAAVAENTRNDLLVRANLSVLRQANLSRQGVLGLLQG